MLKQIDAIKGSYSTVSQFFINILYSAVLLNKEQFYKYLFHTLFRKINTNFRMNFIKQLYTSDEFGMKVAYQYN